MTAAENLAIFLRLFKKTFDRRLWLIFAALSLVESILGVIKPYLFGFALDEAILPKNWRMFLILGGVGAAVFLLGEISDLVKGRSYENLKLALALEMNRLVFWKIQDLSLQQSRDKSAGGHIFDLNNNVPECSSVLSSMPAEFFQLLSRMALTLVIVFHLNWRLSLAALLLSCLVYLPGRIFDPKSGAAHRAIQENTRKLFAFLAEVLWRPLLVKAFGKERATSEAYRCKLDENLRLSREIARLGLWRRFAYNAVTKAAGGIVLAFGFYLVVEGDLTYGSLAAVMVYLHQLITMQAALGGLFSELSDSGAAFEQLDEILKSPETACSGRAGLANGAVNIRNVVFGYRPDENVFQNLDLTVASGEFVVISGESGSGKTTLAMLLLGLYCPSKGEIFLGGEKLENLSPQNFRNDLSVALQEPFLWNDSIYGNISFAATDASSEDVMSAARIARVDEFAEKLPDGYGALAGESGSKLSRGQQQRVALARALLKKPKILLLDEALSSVEPELEEKILVEIRRNLKAATILVISHRMPRAVPANRFFTIKDKKAVPFKP